jgi:hypothetical protein
VLLGVSIVYEVIISAFYKNIKKFVYVFATDAGLYFREVEKEKVTNKISFNKSGSYLTSSNVKSCAELPNNRYLVCIMNSLMLKVIDKEKQTIESIINPSGESVPI